MYKFKFLSDDSKFVEIVCEFDDREVGQRAMAVSCDVHNTLGKDVWTFEEILDTEPGQA